MFSNLIDNALKYAGAGRAHRAGGAALERGVEFYVTISVPASPPSTCRDCSSVSIAWTRRAPANPEAPDWVWPSPNTSCWPTVAPFEPRANSITAPRFCLPSRDQGRLIPPAQASGSSPDRFCCKIHTVLTHSLRKRPMPLTWPSISNALRTPRWSAGHKPLHRPRRDPAMSTATVKVPRRNPRYAHLVRRTVEACQRGQRSSRSGRRGHCHRIDCAAQDHSPARKGTRHAGYGNRCRRDRCHYPGHRTRSARIAGLHEVHDRPGTHRRPAAQLCQQRAGCRRPPRSGGHSRPHPHGDGAGENADGRRRLRSPPATSRKRSTCCAPTPRWTACAI